MYEKNITAKPPVLMSTEIRGTTEGLALFEFYLFSDALTYQSMPQDFPNF
jgi:hypothetical protein